MNPFDLLKNAQNLQEQFSKVQDEMQDITASGSAGGNIVKVTINGQMGITALEIDPIAVDIRDIPMLQDLIIAAHRDAMTNIKDALTEKLGPLAGGLNIPGLH